MVPKINKFDFYSYETIEGKIIQLVGESNETFVPNFLTKSQISGIQRRVKLCEILSRIEFTIESYGLINFFVDYENDIEAFMVLKKLLVEFNDIETIEFIGKSLDFMEVNIEKIRELRSYPDDYEAKHKELEKQISFKNTLHKSTVLIDNEIRRKPDDFCFDELGKPIDPDFSGKLKRLYPDGNIKQEYSFLNGRAHGEGVECDFLGRKERLVLFAYGKRIKVLKRWDKDGNEK